MGRLWEQRALQGNSPWTPRDGEEVKLNEELNSLKTRIGKGCLSCRAAVTLSHFEYNLRVPVAPASMGSYL